MELSKILYHSKISINPEFFVCELIENVSFCILQYSSILLVIFMAEISLLSCGYIFREELTSSFHAGLGKGLQEYGKNSAQTAAIDDIQSTVSNDM